MGGMALRGQQDWPLSEAAARLVDSSMAASTKSAYGYDWTAFSLWCETRGILALPVAPEVLANYVAEAGESLAAATLARQLAAINKVHVMRGFPPPATHPAVAAVMAGLRRTQDRAVRRMRPLGLDHIRKMTTAMVFNLWPAGVAARRDACLILFGFAGAFRRSELSQLHIGDVEMHHADGLHVRVRRSKTDQEGHGQVKGLPFGSRPETCPACAWLAWLEVLAADGRPERMRLILAVQEGHICRTDHLFLAGLDGERPAFVPVSKMGAVSVDVHLSGQAINEVVRRRAKAAGIGPAGFGAHSLRAGFVTSALTAGATEAQVMRQSWHASSSSVATYDREYNPLKGNAVTKLGL